VIGEAGKGSDARKYFPGDKAKNDINFDKIKWKPSRWERFKRWLRRKK